MTLCSWGVGSKGRYSSCEGWQVKLCDLPVTHGPYLNYLEIKGLYIKRYINSSVYFFIRIHPSQINQTFAIVLQNSCALPVAPVGPVKPVEPVGPRSPRGPVDPGAPVKPVAPTGPTTCVIML